MKDFSIKQTSASNPSNGTNSKTDNYSKLYKEYERTRVQMSKSDFANSPVAIEKELTMIAQLKIAAKEQGKKTELSVLEEREQALYTKLANSMLSKSEPSCYGQVSFSGRFSQNLSNPTDKKLDFQQDRFFRLFNQGFKDENVIKSNLQVMHDMGMDIDSAIKILDAIKFSDSDTGNYDVNQETFKKLVTIKKNLATSRNFEKEEYNSPINQIGVQKISVGNSTIIFKNGKATYVSPFYERSVQSMQEEYDSSVSDDEDKLIYDFANKYVDKNGEINSNYIRAMLQLRQAGIVRNQLLEMLEMCTSKDGAIDKNMLSAISQLKSAGTLSHEIKIILNAIGKDEDGHFDKNDIENANALTKSVMEGKDVVSFLSDMRTGEEARDYIVDFATRFGAERLSELLAIVKNSDGIPDENAMDVVNSLIHNRSIYDENGEITAKDFVGISQHMVQVAKDFNMSGEVNDGAVETIFQMNAANIPVEDIEELLKKCVDDDGKINKTLTKILWHMTWDNESVSKMHKVMDLCREKGSIDTENSERLLQYIEHYSPSN